MKLNVIIVCIILLTPGCYSFSQKLKSSNPDLSKSIISQVEVFGGPNILYPKVFSKDVSPGNGINWGYTLGLSLIHRVKRKGRSGRVQVSGGIFFERKHYKNYKRNATQLLNEGLKNDYLTFSLVPRYAFFKGKLYVGVGGYFSSLQKSRTSVIYVDSIGTSYYKTGSSYNLYHKYDAGLLAVVGGSFPLSKRFSFNCQLINTTGFRRVSNTTPLYGLSIERNNDVSLLLGITFLR